MKAASNSIICLTLGRPTHSMSVPSSPEQVSPEWLTSRLNASGLHGSVRDISWKSIGAGQVGDNARFQLTADGDLPNTLVGKFPSTNPMSKNLAIQLYNYAREVFFYSKLASTLDIQVPRCFAVEFDQESHEFIILMEDLAPGVQIDQMSECSLDQAALALEELAKLHGPRWGDPYLAELPLLATLRIGEPEPPPYSAFLDAFNQRYGSRLTQDERTAAEAFGQVQEAYASPDAPKTVIHIDYRLDNMMFGGPHPLTVFDWQSVNHGHAFQDVSYFMGTSISTKQRSHNERALLNHYLDLLRSYGVQVSWDECWRLYRHFAPAGLNMSVLVATLVGETERGNDMFMTMARRSIAMCEDLQSFELLQGY